MSYYDNSRVDSFHANRRWYNRAIPQDIAAIVDADAKVTTK